MQSFFWGSTPATGLSNEFAEMKVRRIFRDAIVELAITER